MVCAVLNNVRTVEWRVNRGQQTAASSEYHVELRVVALEVKALVRDGLLQIAPVCSNPANLYRIVLRPICFLQDPISSD